MRSFIIVTSVMAAGFIWGALLELFMKKIMNK